MDTRTLLSILCIKQAKVNVTDVSFFIEYLTQIKSRPPNNMGTTSANIK